MIAKQLPQFRVISICFGKDKIVLNYFTNHQNDQVSINYSFFCQTK